MPVWRAKDGTACASGTMAKDNSRPLMGSISFRTVLYMVSYFLESVIDRILWRMTAATTGNTMN
jgi:hypothetical protein